MIKVHYEIPSCYSTEKKAYSEIYSDVKCEAIKVLNMKLHCAKITVQKI